MKRILLFLFVILLSQQALCVEKPVTAINVAREELVLFERSKHYFWDSCTPRPVEFIDGYKEIRIGDVIKFKGRVIRVETIEHVTHEARTTEFRMFSDVEEERLHSSDCYITSAAANSSLGVDGCAGAFVMVEGCQVISD